MPPVIIERTGPEPALALPTRPVPLTAEELRVAHNSRVGQIRSLVIKGDIDVQWTDDGKRRTDAGQGVIYFQYPRYIALKYAVADEPVLWAGCNLNFYWGINRQADIACLGRTMNVKGPFEELSPVFLHPCDLFAALGLSQIPADAKVRNSTATLRDQAGGEPIPLVSFIVSDTRVDQVITLDQKSALVRSVEVRDKTGVPLGISRLGGYAPITAVSPSPLPEPPAPQVVLIQSLIANTSLRLRAVYVGEAPPSKASISDTVFDFFAIMRSLNVGRVVILDKAGVPAALTPGQLKQELPGVKVVELSEIFPEK